MSPETGCTGAAEYLAVRSARWVSRAAGDCGPMGLVADRCNDRIAVFTR